MRSIRLLAATTVIVFGAAGCGDDGNEPDNEAPNASFTQVCTGLSCVFTDGSTDSDGTIASRAWTFESGTPATSTDAAPTVTFPAAGTYTVTLNVTDNEGATDETPASQEVTVTAGTGGTPPTASFTLPACTAGTPCGFHSTSTDDVAILSTSWQFGDGGTAEGTDATHTYAAAGAYNVTLTVTDDQGLTGTVTQALTVTAPSAQDCTTSTNQSGGRIVNCTLSFTQRSTVSLTIVSRSCELGGNSLSVTAPRSYVVFSNLCFAGTVGTPVTVTDASGDPIVFEIGSTISLRFNQGTADPGDPATGDPGIEVTGSAQNWTLNIDDGGAAGTEGEPDFNDAVISVTGTAAP
jgi:PKD repeat protein